MSYADTINDEQKAIIQTWADGGDDLSAIQKKLADELSVQVTYMEVRFLIADIGIEMPVKEVPVEEEVSEEVVETPETDAEGSEEAGNEEEVVTGNENPAPEGEPLPAASVKVTMSEVLPPGAMAGGTVTFGDGMQATWGLNQMGQLSLDPTDPAYRPSEADVKAFQMELQKVAQEKGL